LPAACKFPWSRSLAVCAHGLCGVGHRWWWAAVLHDVGVEVVILVTADVTHPLTPALHHPLPYTHVVAPRQTRRKDSEKLPDFQKVDCVSVSFAPFKAAVEDQLQRLSDALVVSLRAALVGNLKTVEGCVPCPGLSPLIEGLPGFP
jgi:hypothetical protein